MKELVERQGYPVKQVCEVVELARSSYYYQSHPADDSQLQAELQQVVGDYPCYGTRRVSQQLGRAPYGYVIGRKRAQRIMRQRKWLQSVKKSKVRTTNSAHPYPRYANLVKNLTITGPDQVWVGDVTFIRLKHGFVYLAILLDVFTRAIRGWSLSKSCDT